MGVLKKKLILEDFITYSTSKKTIKLSKNQEEAVEKAALTVEKIVAAGKPVYGINTGLGDLCDKTIKKEEVEKLQINTIRSHAWGIGEALTKEETKGAMLLLINSLSKGYSGIRLNTLETLIDMYNKEVIPSIPKIGSLGASGDLIPLAHLALVLIGEGEAKYQEKLMSGKQAMQKAGIKPINLKAKEGLALINGTHVVTALSALNLHYALQISKTTDIASAMSFEVLRGNPKNFDSKIHNLKPHKGQKETAQNLRKLIKNSQILSNNNNSKVQDPYSLRCLPQIHGPLKDELSNTKKIIEQEMNSVTDNPLIFEKECLSGGNFHAQYIANAMDSFASTITTLASLSERRIERMLNSQHSKLPPFLTKNSGLNSGFMIAQYSAAAFLSMNKVLSYPANTTSIPVSANQEDYVSMAMTSALKAKEILKNTEYVIAIELLCAAQGIEFHKLKQGKGTKRLYEKIREHIPPLEQDRTPYKDVETIYELIHKGTLTKEVEKEVGGLK